MIGMTVCSGIGAPEHAAPWIDWRYQSEIDKFPSAVLAARFPDAVNLGDMTNFKEWPDATVDVLCGGTPCQSFSVAGLRKGLDDPRGNLMLTYLAIAARYRPKWLVWENVPGVLSSNGGRDFGSFLGGLGQLGYGFAYRVLDVQFGRTVRFPFAIPQRRRRVFVVGYLGDWRRAAAVLFDRESLSGNPPPRREAGQIAAPTISARPTGGEGLGTDFDLDGGLQAVAGCMPHQSHGGVDTQTALNGYLIPVSTFTGDGATHALTGEGHDASEDGSGRGTPVIAFDSKGTQVQFSEAGEAPTLRSMSHSNSHQNAGGQLAVAIQERAVSENPGAGPDGIGCNAEGAAYTIEARNKVQAVAFAQNQRGEMRTSDVSMQLTTGGGKPGQGYPAVVFDPLASGAHPPAVAFDIHGVPATRGASETDVHVPLRSRTPGQSEASTTTVIQTPWAVRRLCPTECERLMGFPENWTKIEWRGKPAEACPDGPRYRSLGNSWGVNAGEYVFDRIRMVEGL